MVISVSSIAWHFAEDLQVATMLRSLGIGHVDLAPTMYFPDLEAASACDIQAVRDRWADRGFAIAGLQSLLFGTNGMNMFEDGDGRMMRRLEASCRIASGLGASRLTFGSPRQRDRSGLTDADTEARALAFFARIGTYAATTGVVLCLEANPAIYGCNFMTGTLDAARIVDMIDLPSIRLQLDTGTIAMNAEPAADTVAAVAGLIGHIHASEPELAELGTGGADHAAIAQALREVGHAGVVTTVEMKRTDTGSNLAGIERAVRVARRHYDRAGAA